MNDYNYILKIKVGLLILSRRIAETSLSFKFVCFCLHFALPKRRFGLFGPRAYSFGRHIVSESI